LHDGTTQGRDGFSEEEEDDEEAPDVDVVDDKDRAAKVVPIWFTASL